MDPDVIVIGSGGAALSAAVTAAARGANVAVMEREPLFGGTTSFSGGGMWIPNNRYARAKGVQDSKEDASRYIKRLVNHTGLDSLIERYLDECNSMLDFMELETNLRFEASAGHPDYQPTMPGARDTGRGVNQGLFDTNRLGPLNAKLRRGWASKPVTLSERAMGRTRLDVPIQERMEAGLMGLGAGLIGFLLEACVDKGVELNSGARAVELVKDGDRVAGVVVVRDSSRETVRAKRCVILACGGFEWNSSLVDRFLGVPMVAPASPGHNVGDGLLMAMKAGAGLASMTEAWWNMMYSIPGDEYEGHQLHRPTSDVRGLPGMIAVNRRGRRFVNEAMNYHDLGKSMYQFDPVAYEYPNAPAYIVFDAQFRASYPISFLGIDDPDPASLIKAGNLAELAELASIDPAGLETEVDHFNAAAARGSDPLFHRGENAYDLYMGDHELPGAAATLRPLASPPYYAVRVNLGVFGTKGGPITNADAQVLDLDGIAMPGLYAAGNTAAHVFGSAYPGPGATLGPALTFGHVAAKHATA